MKSINKARDSQRDAHLPSITESLSPRSTMNEWYLHGKLQYQVTRNNGLTAEKILKESDKMRDAVTEVIDQNKTETEMRLEERISEVKQAKVELENVSAMLQAELGIMNLLKERLRDGIQMIKEKALIITEKCIVLREGRRGIDLSLDEVEKELEREQKKIKGAAEILTTTISNTEETMRLLRAALYVIGKDIEDKLRVLSIEFDCLNMKETSLNLSRYRGEIPLDVSNISAGEWARYTTSIIDSSRKKIHDARILQAHVNTLLKDIVEDLRNQFQATNQAFQRRIDEVKDAKVKLQIQHYEITRQVNDMNQNIAELETTINDKGAFLALAYTRLEKRANRRGIESVKDKAEATLMKEVIEIKHFIGQLQKKLAESQKTLKALLKTQIQLQDAINIKTHSLKIDEVDCMSLRDGMDYHVF